MEEYKQKYEEAMLRMNKWVEGSEIIDPKEVAEFVFPELKESEDEMVRKWLIKAMKHLSEESTFFLEVPKDKVIAWLEKQGEHQEYPKDVIDNATSFLANRNDGMPEEEAKDIVNAIITVLNPSYWPKQGEQKPIISDDAIREGVAHFGITQYQITNWLKKYINIVEQKPADKVEPEPYFYCKYGGTIPLCSDCKRNHINSPFKTEEITTWYVPSKSTKRCIDYIVWPENQDKQKSAWSEEDEKMWSTISDLLWEGYKLSDKKVSWDKIRCWLLPIITYFKDRVQTHPKQEWSEEDDDNIMMIEDRLSDYLDYIREDSTLTKHQKNCLKEKVIGYVNWLKSLKERMKGE